MYCNNNSINTGYFNKEIEHSQQVRIGILVEKRKDFLAAGYQNSFLKKELVS